MAEATNKAKKIKRSQIVAMLFQNMGQYDARETLRLVDEYAEMHVDH